VQARLDAGQLTEEMAVHSPLRHVILHALGAEDQLERRLSFVDLEHGDCVLLCSDGLSNKVGDDNRDVDDQN
jgi:protein phosphatase